MTLLIVAVSLVLVVSAFCSLSEASLYAVRRPFIRQLVDGGSRTGAVLNHFKDNMERPITAILVVNTIANTAGAAVAGAQATRVWGPGSLVVFSIAFTLGVLFISEIIPKIVGVAYNRAIAQAVALPWQLMIFMLTPITALVTRFSGLLQPSGPSFAAPEEEVQQLVQMSAEEGSILGIEAEIVRNALNLDLVVARDIMTPRTVVYRLPHDTRIGDLRSSVADWHFSRIPVVDPEDGERWTGVVRAQDVLRELAADRFDTVLSDLAQPLQFVGETLRGHELLERFLKERTHLFGVVDEFGGVAGVTSLEDVLESLIGAEIVDEVDQAADLRDVARRSARARSHRKQMDKTEQDDEASGPGE